MNPNQIAFWERIRNHDFDPDHALNITARLARDKGWPIGFARGAVAEYGKFCFLAIVSETPMTPSEKVDEVWHVHLTYSRKYYVWCATVLLATLHHDPTQGGPAEQQRYRRQGRISRALFVRRSTRN